MSTDFYQHSTREHAEKYFAEHGVDFTLVMSDDELRSIAHDFALVIFHAPWSSYSIGNIHRILTRVAARPANDLETYLVDSDSISDEVKQHVLGAMCHGYGEAVLFSSGKEIAHHWKSFDLEPFLATVHEVRKPVH